MMHVLMRMVVLPKLQEHLLFLFERLMKTTQDERGCISCRLYRDAANENAVIFVEEWESRADLETHIGTRNFQKILAAMELLSEPPEIRFIDAYSIAGMDFINQAKVASGRLERAALQN